MTGVITTADLSITFMLEIAASIDADPVCEKAVEHMSSTHDEVAWMKPYESNIRLSTFREWVD